LLLLAAAVCLHTEAQAANSPPFIKAQRAEANGQYARAEALYSEAYTRDPANTQALFGRARMRSWLGKFNASIDDYREGLRREPQGSALVLRPLHRYRLGLPRTTSV
jgi:tetratricopeptide (TPR) repeat protein